MQELNRKLLSSNECSLVRLVDVFLTPSTWEKTACVLGAGV